MKKVMTLMLGVALAFTTVAVCFAQDTAKKEDTKKRQEEGQQEEGRATKKEG